MIHTQFIKATLSSLTMTHARHRGVSLLEVLFSIGIISIGILGTIALIPFAGYQAKEGSKADVGATMGKSMVEEFQVRGMNDLSRLRTRTPDGGGNNNAFNFGVPSTLQGFCIDPLAIGAANANFIPNLTAGNIDAFPYVSFSAGDYLPMERVTLPDDLIVSGSPNFRSLMTYLQAKEIFIAQNDLLFQKPDDSTLPPVPEWARNTTNKDIVKRESNGYFSWIATLAPKIDQGLSATGTFSDLYTLSIVIFYQRDTSFSLNGVNERLAAVSSFPGAGVGGSDVVLQARSGRPAEDLDLKRNDWIMLFALASGANFTGAEQGQGAFYRWYRVIDADDIDTTNNPPTRVVTLHGPDWTRMQWDPTLGRSDFKTTYAALVKNVVAVYEKTIRMRNSSLWN